MLLSRADSSEGKRAPGRCARPAACTTRFPSGEGVLCGGAARRGGRRRHRRRLARRVVRLPSEARPNSSSELSPSHHRRRSARVDVACVRYVRVGEACSTGVEIGPTSRGGVTQDSGRTSLTRLGISQASVLGGPLDAKLRHRGVKSRRLQHRCSPKSGPREAEVGQAFGDRRSGLRGHVSHALPQVEPAPQTVCVNSTRVRSCFGETGSVAAVACASSRTASFELSLVSSSRHFVGVHGEPGACGRCVCSSVVIIRTLRRPGRRY